MARGIRGEGGGPSSVRRRKIAIRFQRINRDHAALEEALGPFADRDSYVGDWQSDEIAAIHRLDLVERGFEKIVNSLIEIVDQAEAEAVAQGLAPGRQEGGVNRWRRLQGLGVLSVQRSERMIQIARRRALLQHGYADLYAEGAGALYDDVTALLEELPRVVVELDRWVERLWPGG